MNDKSELTRRDFVGTAAAATAFTIVPQSVLGNSAPSNLVNIAVVGQRVEIDYPSCLERGVENKIPRLFFYLTSP